MGALKYVSNNFSNHIIIKGILFIISSNNRHKGWTTMHIMRGLWVSKNQSIKVWFAFSKNVLKSQDLQLKMKYNLYLFFCKRIFVSFIF